MSTSGASTAPRWRRRKPTWLTSADSPAHEPEEKRHPWDLPESVWATRGSEEPRRGGALRNVSGVLYGYCSHSWTVSWLSFTQSAPASSGSCLSPAIAFATSSWSSFVSFIFFSMSYAADPPSANFFENSLLMMVTSYSHLYCSGSPPSFASSLQSLFASVRGGSLTSARSYCWLRYCGVYQ